MQSQRARRTTRSGIASGLVACGLFGGMAMAMAADAGPQYLEAYHEEVRTQPIADSATSQQLAAAIEDLFGPQPASEAAGADTPDADAPAAGEAEQADREPIRAAAGDANGEQRRVVEVVLTRIDWQPDGNSVDASGYAAVLEAGGTCYLRLSDATGQVAIIEAAASEDVSTANCGALSITGAQLSPGEWTAVLAYASATSIGASAPIQVVIP